MKMKILIAYKSSTGNTKKVAEAMHSVIAGKHDVTILPVKKVESLKGYDLSFLGFPILGEGPGKDTVRILQRLCTKKSKVALFITHAAPAGAPPVKGWIKQFTDAAKASTIVGTFDCQGQLSWIVKFIMRISTNPEWRQWAKMDNSKGHPDAADLKKAAEFAKKIVRKI